VGIAAGNADWVTRLSAITLSNPRAIVGKSLFCSGSMREYTRFETFLCASFRIATPKIAPKCLHAAARSYDCEPPRHKKVSLAVRKGQPWRATSLCLA
jgi:hypothetical protein